MGFVKNYYSKPKHWKKVKYAPRSKQSGKMYGVEMEMEIVLSITPKKNSSN